MAKQMSFTDAATQAFYTASYWIPRILIVKANQSGAVIFDGYADISARQAGAKPVAMKRFLITSELYDSYFSPSVQDVEGMNQEKAAYLMADADESGFFSAAIDV